VISFPANGPSVGIVGTGSYLPVREVPNEIVAAWVGVTEEDIVRKTGIRSRWYAADHEATSDLALRAAEAALADAGVTAEDLGAIIVATATPDQPQPATACKIQYGLGATRATAFDVNAVCSGFIAALMTASQLVLATAAEAPRHALVIGADVFSRILDRTDRKTVLLFGDGAGAVVLGPTAPGTGLMAADLVSYGEHYAMIQVEAGGSRVPASKDTLASGLHYFRMDGRAVREFVTAELPKAVQRLLSGQGTAPAAIDHVVPHQANDVLLKEVMPLLQLPRARVHLTIAEHGNTSAASIPLALDTAHRAGAFSNGEVLLLAGFGGGMSMGTALLKWTAGQHAPAKGKEESPL
jgi:acetoacetyl-CoA synthase